MAANVSVNKAIWRARITLLVLPVIVSLSAIVVSVYLANHGFETWIVVVTGIVVILAILFYRNKMTARWYIWALTNVRNVHELRQRAIFSRLMPNKYNQLILPTDKNYPVLLELQKKFDIPDEYRDDPDVPAVTRIYTAKAQRIFMLVIMVVVFVGGITLVIVHHYLAGAIACIVSGYLVYDSYRMISDRDPQIIISNEGIETVTSGFHSWKEIKNEIVGIDQETDYKGLFENYSNSGRRTVYYLSYDFDGGEEKMFIYDLGITHWKLARLLRLYRGRNI